MNYIFYIVYAIWLLSEILISRKQSGGRDRTGLDKNTLTRIWLTVLTVFPLSIWVDSHVDLPITDGQWIYLTGLGVIILGCMIRWYCVYALGREFTANVSIRTEHKLKTTGIYRYFRHPSYSASLLSFFGFALVLNNWISLLVIMIPMTWAFTQRIIVEERVLTEEFGEAYTNYRNRTFGLLPFRKG